MKPVYDVWFSNRVAHERDGTGHDTDLEQSLSVYGQDLLDGHLDLRLAVATDFDIDQDDSVDRAFDESWPRVHEASLDFRDYGPVSHLVLGRQDLPKIDFLHLDGVSLSLWEDRKVGVFAFGGRPVSYYTSNGGEWVGGGGIRVRPLPSTLFQADSYAINDRGEDTVASALRVSQRFITGFGDSLEARWIDSDFRDLRARVYYTRPGIFDIAARVYWQAMTLGEDDATFETRYFSLYSGFLGPAAERLSFKLDATRYLGDHLILSASGGYARILDRDAESDPEDFTNVDSAQTTLGLTVVDWLRKGLTFDVYADYYWHPDEDFYGLTGEVNYTFSPKFRAGCGVSRDMYNFNDYLPFSDRFGNPVRDETGGKQASNTVFLEARYKASSHWRFSLRTEYEDVDRWSEDAYSIVLQVDYRFHTPATN